MKIIGLDGNNATGTEIWEYNDILIKRTYDKKWFVALDETETRLPPDKELDEHRAHYFDITDPYEWLPYAVNIYFA